MAGRAYYSSSLDNSRRANRSKAEHGQCRDKVSAGELEHIDYFLGIEIVGRNARLGFESAVRMLLL